MMAWLARCSAGVLLLGAASCKEPPVPPTNILIKVTTTRGQPVAGAEVRTGETVAARSDRAGEARLVFGGREGDTVELRVQCPAPLKLKSPTRPIVVRRLAIEGGTVEHTVRCEEQRRTLIVAVRADNGPDLPILYLGSEVGRTDRSGVAHVKIDADIHEPVELKLSTEAAEMRGAHPQNPIAMFDAADHDEIREFAMTFKRDPKKAPRRIAPSGPAKF